MNNIQLVANSLYDHLKSLEKEVGSIDVSRGLFHMLVAYECELELTDEVFSRLDMALYRFIENDACTSLIDSGIKDILEEVGLV